MFKRVWSFSSLVGRLTSSCWPCLAGLSSWLCSRSSRTSCMPGILLSNTCTEPQHVPKQCHCCRIRLAQLCRSCGVSHCELQRANPTGQTCTRRHLGMPLAQPPTGSFVHTCFQPNLRPTAEALANGGILRSPTPSPLFFRMMHLYGGGGGGEICCTPAQLI